jgi:hypothetical protein
MSAKAIVPGAVILALLGGLPARAADDPPMPMTTPAAGDPTQTQPPESLPPPMPEPTAAVQPTTPATGNGLPPGSVVDPWIAYARPGCCGPLGGDGPISSEWFLRNGVSMPVATGILHEALQTGWMTEFGARALFFNPDTDAAWTASASLSYTYNNSGRGDLVFRYPEGFLRNVLNPVTGLRTNVVQFENIPVTIRDYQRWSLNTALGRERYFFNPAYRPGWHLRFGWDSGGRWGYGRAELNDLSGIVPPNNPQGIESNVILFRRRSDVFGTVFVSLHSDLEVPICCGAAYFISGIRAEWNYNWTNLFPGQPRDLQDVNLLWTVGFRY